MADPGATPSVRAQVVGSTDVGKVREHNEDSFLVFDRDSGKALAPGQGYTGELRSAVLLVVCDGMGGAAAGEVASRMAAQKVADILGKADYGAATPDQVASLMDRAVQEANQEVFEKARSTPEMKGMGTTLTAAVVTRDRLFVSQVGDSRAYLLRKGLLNQITKDQSLIGQLIEEGTLTEEEAEKLGGRNIVLQAVGVEENLRVDTKSWPLLRGDVVLLCSDGLSGMVKDPRMREILAESGEDLPGAAEKLITEANANGGRDNITVVLGRFDGEGLRPPMETETAAGAETAGAAFKAPPPPEVPNPMRKVAAWGAVLLVAIAVAFLAFRPTTAEMTLAVRPPGAEVKLLDAEGKVVRQTKAGSAPVRFEKLEPGEYKLVITAPDHFELESELPIREHGKANLPAHLSDVWLVPMPGRLLLSAAQPDVTARLTLTPDHPKAEPIQGRELRPPTEGDALKVDDTPVGAWVLEATRPGFRARRLEGRVEPKEEEKVVVPALEELRGTLVVEGLKGGKLEVETDAGEDVPTPGATGDSWSGEVRAEVRLVVRATWKDFKPFEEVVQLKEGERVVVKVAQEADRVAVTFGAPPNTTVVVEQHDGNAWAQVRELGVKTDGFTYTWNASPGRYRARTEDGKLGREFEVKAGSAAMRLELGPQ